MNTEPTTPTAHDEAGKRNRSTLRWLTDGEPLMPHPVAVAAYALLAVIGAIYLLSTLGGQTASELNLSYYGDNDTALVIDDILREGDRVVAVIENHTSEPLVGTINCRFESDESLVGYSVEFESVAANSNSTVDLTTAYLNDHPERDTVDSVTGCSVRWPQATDTSADPIATGAHHGVRSFDRESSDLLDARLGR